MSADQPEFTVEYVAHRFLWCVTLSVSLPRCLSTWTLTVKSGWTGMHLSWPPFQRTGSAQTMKDYWCCFVVVHVVYKCFLIIGNVGVMNSHIYRWAYMLCRAVISLEIFFFSVTCFLVRVRKQFSEWAVLFELPQRKQLYLVGFCSVSVFRKLKQCNECRFLLMLQNRLHSSFNRLHRRKWLYHRAAARWGWRWVGQRCLGLEFVVEAGAFEQQGKG